MTRAEETELTTLLDEMEMELGAVDMKTLRGADLCRKYHRIRPKVKKVINFIGKVPFLGRISLALEFLVEMADLFCPTKEG